MENLKKKFYIQKIRLKNIMVYEDETINLEGFYHNTILLSGRYSNSYDMSKINGTGKSTIILSILVNLTLLSSYKSILRMGQEEGLIELYLKEINGNDEILIRRIVKKNNQGMEVFHNGKMVDYQKIQYLISEFIEPQILGMNREDFIVTKIFTQYHNILMDLSGVNILKTLEQLFKIDDFDKLYQDITEKMKQSEDEIRKIEKEEAKITVSIEQHEKELINSEESLKEIERNENKLKEQRNVLKEMLNQIEQEKKKLLENISFKTIEEIDKVIKDLKQKKKKIDNEYIEQKTNEKTIKNKIKEIQQLKSLDKCPTCKRPITQQDHKIYDDMINELIVNLEKLNQEKYEKEIKKIEEEINQLENLESKLYNIEKNNQKIESEYKSIESKNNKELKEKIQQRIQELKKIIQEEKESLTKIKEKRSEIEKDIFVFQTLKELVKPKSQVRQKYIYEFISNLNILSKRYSDYFFQEDYERFRIILDNLEIQFGLERLGDFYPYQILSTGERRKVGLVLIFTLNDILKVVNDSNLKIMIFDDYMTGLDEESINQVLQIIGEYQRENNYQIFLTNNNIVQPLEDTVIIDIVKNEQLNQSKINKIEKI